MICLGFTKLGAVLIHGEEHLIHSYFVENLDFKKFKRSHARSDGRNMHKRENINILLGKGGMYIHIEEDCIETRETRPCSLYIQPPSPCHTFHFQDFSLYHGKIGKLKSSHLEK